MSKRPREEKKIRKLEKALRRTPPARIDLVEWLKRHKHAQTSGEARKLLTDGRVRIGSHVVGRVEIETSSGKEFFPVPLIPAEQGEEIIVLEAA